MSSRKAVGPDEIPAELLNLDLDGDRDCNLRILEQCHAFVIGLKKGGDMPQLEWKDAATIAIRKKKDRTECGNY